MGLMREESKIYGSCGGYAASPSTPYPTASLAPAAAAVKVPFGVELVRERVVIDGIVLTRAQIMKAVQIASVPEPPTLDTSKFANASVRFGNYHISIQDRGYGPLKGKGLYLSSLPAGYEWALVRDSELGEEHRVLTVQSINTSGTRLA